MLVRRLAQVFKFQLTSLILSFSSLVVSRAWIFQGLVWDWCRLLYGSRTTLFWLSFPYDIFHKLPGQTVHFLILLSRKMKFLSVLADMPPCNSRDGACPWGKTVRGKKVVNPSPKHLSSPSCDPSTILCFNLFSAFMLPFVLFWVSKCPQGSGWCGLRPPRQNRTLLPSFCLWKCQQGPTKK